MSVIPIPLPEARASGRDALVDTYWERAYRFAAMVTRNDQESADVAQEALLKVLTHLDSFRPELGSFESYLWRIVLNVARDTGRAAGRRQALLDRLRRGADAARGGDAEAIALQHLSDERLLAAVRRLPKHPRTVIALRFGARLPYREIGDQMGISEAAALMATRRALSALRKVLESKEAPR